MPQLRNQAGNVVPTVNIMGVCSNWARPRAVKRMPRLLAFLEMDGLGEAVLGVHLVRDLKRLFSRLTGPPRRCECANNLARTSNGRRGGISLWPIASERRRPWR